MKAYKGIGMEGSVARWYDKTTRRDMPEFVGLAARIAALVPASAMVLEVALGPGFLSIGLANRGRLRQVVAVRDKMSPEPPVTDRALSPSP